MSSVSYPLRIPEEVIALAELRTREEHVDKSTALRQLLYLGVERYVMKLYRDGRISLSRAAKMLGKSVHDVMLLAEREKAKTGATLEQQEKSERTAKTLRA